MFYPCFAFGNELLFLKTDGKIIVKNEDFEKISVKKCNSVKKV